MKFWLIILQYSEAVDEYGNYYRNIAFYVVWALAIASVFLMVRNFFRFLPIHRPFLLHSIIFLHLPCSFSYVLFISLSLTLLLYSVRLYIILTPYTVLYYFILYLTFFILSLYPFLPFLYLPFLAFLSLHFLITFPFPLVSIGCQSRSFSIYCNGAIFWKHPCFGPWLLIF